LRCHQGNGLVRCTEMDATEAEKANARRVQWLLYGLVIVMIGAPVLVFFLRNR
jgi:hypothetical protein